MRNTYQDHKTTFPEWSTTLIQTTKAVLLISLLVAIPVAMAQGVSGRIVGTVVDATGAVIPNAAVTISNQDTGAITKVTTNGSGQYRADTLRPGNYQLKIEAPGLQTIVSNGNVVTVDNATVVDMTMKAGSTSETVIVSSASPLIDTTSSSMGEVLNANDITSLPLNGRVFSQLVQTVPGSVAAGFGSAPEAAAGAGSSGSITASVNGMPWGGTTYTLDGVNNMELLNAFINVTPPLDAIQELKISTNNADITVGTYGGAQVNAFMKSGTNAFHGSAYEFFRDDALSAYKWRATSKAPYRANQFGGSIGGPILRNKAFFFADYQGLLLRNGISYILTVPTDLMKQGTFLKSQFPAAIYDPTTRAPFPTVTTPQGDAWLIPRSRFDKVSANMVNGNTIWPTATNQNAISNNYNANTVEPDDNHQFDVKGDYQFGPSDRIFVRESYQRRDLTAPSPGTPFVQIGDVNATTRDHNAAIGYSHIFSTSMVNELRVGFNRFYTLDFGNDYGTNQNTAVGIPNGNDAAFGATGFGNFSIGNIVQTGSQGWTNSHRISNSYQLTDNLTKVWGSHTFTFGEDFRRLQASLTNSDANKNGDFTYISDYTSSCTMQPNCSNPAGGNQFASFLLGMPSSTDRGYVATQPATRATLLGVYVQDQYRIRRNLTLNLALRWDLITAAIDKNNKQSNFNLTTGVLEFATDGNRAPNVNNYYGGYSPRVGFAYTPGGNNTTISGAFGVTHFPGNFGAMGGFLERNFPFFEVFTSPAQQRNVPLPSISVTGLPQYVPTPITAPVQPPPGVGVSLMTRNFQPDVAYAWNLGVQQRLTNSASFSITYVGTRGVHLFRRYNINTPPPGNTSFNSRLPYKYFNSQGQQYATNIGYATADGASMYHGLQTEFKMNLMHGLTGRVNYTWSKEIDDMNVWWPLDDRFNRGEGTNQAPNIPQNFIVSLIYKLPFGRGERWMAGASRPAQILAGGWQLSTFTRLQSGTPLTFNAAFDNLGSGVTNRANVTCSSVRTFGSVSKWFDTSCFTTPAPLQLGNSGSGKVHGPGFYNADVSLSKTETIHEQVKITIQADAFNVSNTPHYSNPDTNLSDANFGQISGANGIPRQFQLGAHLTF
ncbi:carboxypeptidase regulatory-like domain-containing protein [Edaphobacter aggregans]|uniref:carboxypeptidase regulatory-like domain-containing protein n=1 Tax=Edaphobacter aggregans TaxID=570835 RepID=UPI000552747D|nr:carboxypeptidase regulatory-like domain-containing protein [Edaphobacter aggregans]